MNLFLVLFLLSVLTFVSAQKESCVCDCDSGQNRPGNKPWMTTLYPDRPYTDRPNPNRPIPDRPNPDRPYPSNSNSCRCLKEHRNPHLFCGSRDDQLVGNCRPNALYSCGPRSNEAVVYKMCRSCVEVHSEDFHGTDSCRGEMSMNLKTETDEHKTEKTE